MLRVLALALCAAPAAGLRAAQAPPAAAVADMIAAAMNGEVPTQAPPAAAAAPAGPAQHKKVDVGFTDFLRNMSVEVSDDIRKSTNSSAWTDDLRNRLVANVTQTVNASLLAELKPLKQSIGKTWMAFKADESKDAYVDKIRDAFQPVFERGAGTIKSHLQLALHHVESLSTQKQKLAPEQLLAQCAAALNENLIGQHCYDEHKRTAKTASAAKAKVSLAQEDDPKGKFCIQSVVSGIVHRLHDTEGLIGMTMKFEAGALALVQKEKASEHKK